MVIVKSGAEIAGDISIREVYTEPNQDKDSQYISLISEQYVSLSDFNECLNILEEVVAQGCLDDKGEKFDSMALYSYADAIRYLAKQDRLVIVSDVGKRVIAKTIKKEVQ